MSINIAGRVVDRRTGQGIPSMRVEAWALPSILAHRSPSNRGLHQHYFEGATETMHVLRGDGLIAYVYLDPADPPREVMLQWNDGSWEHRAYWGEDLIAWGSNDTPSRRHMGGLPPTGAWVRLEVPANTVQLEGRDVNGMAFTLFGGSAVWDHAGKAKAKAPPAQDFVWVEDALPQDAVPLGNEAWNWIDNSPQPFSGPGRIALGGAGADSEGEFRMALDERRVSEAFPAQIPHIYFRVLHDTDVLASTENSVVWSANGSSKDVTIDVDLVSQIAPPPLPFRGRLLDLASETPLAGLSVHGFRPAGARPPDELGRALTDADGNFMLLIPVGALAGSAAVASFQLEILTADGVTLQQVEVTPAATGMITDVAVELPALPSPSAVPLSQLAPELGQPIDPALLDFLQQEGLGTLTAIREAGDIHQLSGLPVSSQDPVLDLLQAHARLSVLPTEIALNTQLYEAGYGSLDDIARAPLEDFVASVAGRVDGVVTAAAIHSVARAGMQLVQNRVTEQRLAGTGSATPLAYRINALLPATCACSCLTADSQFAYLADLLDWTVRNLKQNGAALTLSMLEDRFHQPFRRLPASCPASQPLRQVRIAIEVLRAQLPVAYRNYAPAWYLVQAYETLLAQNGTSFDEVRRARSMKPRDRLEIGTRLMVRVDASPTHHDELDELFRDPSQVSEGWLGGMFGLRDTTMDPLQPDSEPGLLVFRRHYLREQWRLQDWPAIPVQGATPVIDPDLVGLADIRDTSAASPILQLWQTRLDWINQFFATVDGYRNDPNIGLDQLLRSGQWGLGSNLLSSDGLGVADIRGLRQQRQHGIRHHAVPGDGRHHAGRIRPAERGGGTGCDRLHRARVRVAGRLRHSHAAHQGA